MRSKLVTAEISPEALDKITTRFPSIIREKHVDWHTLVVDKDDLLALAVFLKSESDLDFDFLTNLSGVDYLDYMEIVYHLYSYGRQHKMCLKVRVTSRADPVVDSVTGIWTTAGWHEREAYDLFGIVFKGHANLKRIFCTDDFPGHPFRKDWELHNDEEYLLRDVKTSKEYGMPEDLPS